MREKVPTPCTKPPWIKLQALTVILAAAFVVYVVLGSGYYSPAELFHGLLHPREGDAADAVWRLRIPRACACLLVGANLGLVGSGFQALFRNPLAEPYVVGVSSGAAVGGAAAMVCGLGSGWQGGLSVLGKMAAAFPAGLLSLWL